MQTKDAILKFRTQHGLSQDELAQRVFVTRQAVSRWENGDTIPNTDTLKLLSKLFDVSIDALLGEPRQWICQCCGMPLQEGNISHETSGEPNASYCKQCYRDGEYTYDTMDDLLQTCDTDTREHLRDMLPTLSYWKRYRELGGDDAFEQFKDQLIAEFNALSIDGMPTIDSLNALVGSFVNLEYRLPNGNIVRFLDDAATYLGNQVPCEFDETRCFGLIANMDFLLVCTYGENSENPELVLYKKR